MPARPEDHTAGPEDAATRPPAETGIRAIQDGTTVGLSDDSLVDAGAARPLAESGPRYRQVSPLGRGGMGEVWLEQDLHIGRQVARKTLLGPLNATAARGRFLREARVQGQLEHPGVVPVYDLGVDDDGKPFFTMKRIRGETLADILNGLSAGHDETRKRYSRHRLLSSFVRICLAIEYAHARGVVHRDLKPSNLMLGEFGETYVLDWGIAKLTRGDDVDEAQRVVSSGSTRDTREGELLGTLLYMPPEQMQGRPVDRRADVYALGAILFEILTLTAFRSGTTPAQIYEVAGRQERPSTRAKVPTELDELCARALNPDVNQRLGSAKELAEGLERYLDGERDQSARREQAQRLLQQAREELTRPGVPAAQARVEAMRAALKALALAPEETEPQQLLLSLVLDSSGDLPPEAEEEFGETDVRDRQQGARIGVLAFLSWLAPLGLSLWVGVRDWTLPGPLTALVLLCAAASAAAIRHGLRSPLPPIGLSLLSGLAVAGSSCWLGPFVLVPAVAAGSAVFFVMHAGRRERPWLILVWALSALLPFAVELTGRFSPAYSFHSGDLVLHARALRLPEGPTIAGLAYMSVAFLVLLCVFVGRLRDRQRAAERSLFVQAWHLRQLFPAPKP